jgi:integrase
MTARHELLGGKVQVYRRPNSPYWHCSSSVAGVQFRASTKQEGLSQAKDFAEDWFLTLKGKDRFGGGIAKGKTFRKAAEKFLDEYEVITGGERNERYVETLRHKITKHLNPFFGDKVVTEITPGLVQEYRVMRAKNVGKPKPPARTTIHHEIIAIRHVLKTANRHGWLEHLPDMSAPYRASGKIAHRAWFSQEEYKALYLACRKRASHPPHPKWKWECEQFRDYVLFMANTGLRPDEAARLEFRDVVIVDDDSTGERILEIEVRGKRGVGFCKSMPGAVRPFERLRDRKRAVIVEPAPAPMARKGAGRGSATTAGPNGTTPAPMAQKGVSRGSSKSTEGSLPGPMDRLFGPIPREMMNTVLGELGLKFDRDRQPRTSYSLRHTYICFRLMEGADIYQVAKNCRTSVEMIEKYYASHIKNMLDASAINVRRIKASPDKSLGTLSEEED